MATNDPWTTGYGGSTLSTPSPVPSPTSPAAAPAAGAGVSPDFAAAQQQAMAQMAAMGMTMGGGSSEQSVRSADTLWYTGIRTGYERITQPLPGDIADDRNGGAIRVRPGFTRGHRVDIVESPEELMKKWYAEDDFQQQWAQKMRDAGWLDEDSNAFDENQMFQNFLMEAGAFAYSNPDLSLDDIYARMVKDGQDDGSGSSSSGVARQVQVGDQQSSSQRDTRVDLTNPTEAKRLINTLLADYLGRDASSEQYNAFLEVLHEAQRDNPVVSESNSTQTVTSVDEDGYDTSTSTSTTSSGGVDAQQIAIDYARDLPEYSRYQASTTFMQAFEDLLNNPMGGI